VCQIGPRLIGFTAGHLAGLFPSPRPWHLPDRPSPETIASGSFLGGGSPLQSAFRSPPAPRLSVQSARLLGSRPSSRHHRVRPLLAGFPSPATFRPQVFSTSRRLTPHTGYAGLFHPRPRTGFDIRPGASLCKQPCRARRAAVPPCRSELERSPAETGCHDRAPRLRGFDPLTGAWLQDGD
jgi:hypothetical protein